MNVRYRLQALEDVEAIYNWRAQQSFEIADKIEAAIFATAKWLGRHAEFGAITDEPGVRRWPMIDFRYTIFYRVDANEVDVLRIMDARQVRDYGASIWMRRRRRSERAAAAGSAVRIARDSFAAQAFSDCR